MNISPLKPRSEKFVDDDDDDDDDNNNNNNKTQSSLQLLNFLYVSVPQPSLSQFRLYCHQSNIFPSFSSPFLIAIG
jgi:hypothetical protein